MDIRYSVSPEDVKRYTTEELRKEFLITDMYQPDQVTATYSHVDRVVVMGIMPVDEIVAIDKGIDVWKNFGTHYFLERREAGLFNLGGPGVVEADGKHYDMKFEDCLYLTKETKTVTFSSREAKNPARFYVVSAPAHKVCRSKLITFEEANKRPCGDTKSANKRVINQFIHPDVLETCQLCMGLTKLEPGSVWNSMPAHTHERRMEVYTYFDLPEDHAVLHLMGQADQTRHLMMHNYEAVISPSWSMHAGCGTTNYTFIWAMAGENQEFDDMDQIKVSEMR